MVPYRHYNKVQHQLCCVRLLRELAAAALSEEQSWANDMAGLLVDTWHHVLDVKANDQLSVRDDALTSLHATYRSIIAQGHGANPPPTPTGRRGRPKRSKAHNLLALVTHPWVAFAS
jgi:transposase